MIQGHLQGRKANYMVKMAKNYIQQIEVGAIVIL